MRLSVRNLVSIALLFAVGFVIGTTNLSPFGAAGPSTPANSRDEGFAEQWLPGEQLLLIYVGRSTCAWCNHPDFRPAFDSVANHLRRQAKQRRYAFLKVAVLLDRAVEPALEHLTHFGTFDEIAVGYGMANSGSLRYLWDGYGGPVATPQLLVVRRTMNVARKHPDTQVFAVSEERLIERRVGLWDIVGWANAGAPLRWRGLDVQYGR